MSVGTSLQPSAVCEGILAAVKAVTPYDMRTPRDTFQGRIGDQAQIPGDRYVQVVPVGAQRNQRLLDAGMVDLVVEVQLHYKNTSDNWSRAINDQGLVASALDQWTLDGVHMVRVALGTIELATDTVIQATIPVTVTFNMTGA